MENIEEYYTLWFIGYIPCLDCDERFPQNAKKGTPPDPVYESSGSSGLMWTQDELSEYLKGSMEMYGDWFSH